MAGVPPRSLLLDWFAAHGWTPFPFQQDVWEAYLAGQSGLIHAATGTGKTYAAWMGPLLEWLAEHPNRASWAKLPAPPLQVLWITPLRALAGDTENALRQPLADLGLPWTLERRTGDTSAAVRARQQQRLPSTLITTPESLSLLLSQPNAAERFQHLRAVIVDEWHELLGSKRGVQAELCLARLRHWRPELRTWGLSATLGNLPVAMAALFGVGSLVEATHAGAVNPGRLVQGVLPKPVRIDSLLPRTPERFSWAANLGLSFVAQVAKAVEEGQSALLFTNTRAQTEIWYRALLGARPDWAGIIALHYGSLDRDTREWVEDSLRQGTVRCVVCTSSLDLGVDFAPVDRVLQIGSPKSIARLVQRAGRSGHQPGAESRVTYVPTYAFDLVEVAAARAALEQGLIEGRLLVDKPLDVLVQHAVTIALGGGFRSPELLAEVRTTLAYQHLTEDEWRWVLDFVTRGGQALKGYPEYSRVVEQNGQYLVTDAEVARRHRLSMGTIVSESAIQVRYLRGEKLGTVEESFIARLHPGDRFVFAGRPLEFVRVRDMTAWVRKAPSLKGAIPRWSGLRQALSPELSLAVRAKLEEARLGQFHSLEMQTVRPMFDLQTRWSRIPAMDELLIERVQTRDGHHLFFYPFEGRLVHEGLAALFAYRISRLAPISFTVAANDYGFELLSPEPVSLEDALGAGLLSTKQLLADIQASLNATEMAKRQFREIAQIAGLVFPGFPGTGKSARQLQASSGLFYDVFARYDPENLLLYQAEREVLERQLERSRLGRTLERLSASRVIVLDVPRPTPFAFPILVDRLRETVSSEKLADRVRRMQEQLEQAANPHRKDQEKDQEIGG